MVSDLKQVLSNVPAVVSDYVNKYAGICEPKDVYLCDGSVEEATRLKQLLVDAGMLVNLPKLDDCWYCCTDPNDVARVESRTYISTPEKRTTIPTAKPGVNGRLGTWKSPETLYAEVDERLPGCMAGRTMYVIPFSMGAIGGPLSKWR